MEQMAEQVAGSHYQRLHHMLSESNWSRAEVRQQLIVDANAHFGHGAALVFLIGTGSLRCPLRTAA